MTDPVRPVAPREDELRKLILKWRKEAAAWQHGIGENQNTRLLKECASELEALFAVEHTCDGGMNPPFPGPCAACARESGEEQLNYFCPTCHQRLIHDKAIGAIPPNLQGPAGGARDEADARERDAGSSQSTGASIPLAAAPVPCAASPAEPLGQERQLCERACRFNCDAESSCNCFAHEMYRWMLRRERNVSMPAKRHVP